MQQHNISIANKSDVIVAATMVATTCSVVAEHSCNGNSSSATKGTLLYATKLIVCGI